MNLQSNVLMLFLSFSIGSVSIGILTGLAIRDKKSPWPWFLFFFLSYSLVIFSDLMDHYYRLLPGSSSDLPLIVSSLLSTVGIHSMIIFAPIYSHGLLQVSQGRKRNWFFILFSLGLYLIPLFLSFIEDFSLEGLGFFFIGPLLIYCIVLCLKNPPVNQSEPKNRIHRLWTFFLAALLLSLVFEIIMGQVLYQPNSESGLQFLFYRQKTLYHLVFILFGVLYSIQGVIQLVNKAGKQSEPIHVPFPSSLTQRETQVLDLVIRGRNNAEIARELFITVATVKAHLTKIFQKTETNGRFQLIAKYHVSIS